MNVKTKSTLILSMVFLSYQAFAAQNPVTWTSVPKDGLPGNSRVGDHLSVVYTIVNQLPFPAPISIESTGIKGPFSIDDQCSRRTIAPRANCLVRVNFDPTEQGDARASLALKYHDNVVPLPTLQTTVAGGSSGTTMVEGNVVQPLASPSCVNQGPYSFTLGFTNTGTLPVTGNGTVSSNIPVNVTHNGCTSQTLTNNGDSCQISGNISPTVTGSITVQGAFAYNSGSSTALTHTSTTVQSGGSCSTGLTGSVTLPFPAQTFPYADNNIQFSFQNTGGSSLALGTVSLVSSTTNIIKTPGVDNCSNHTLAPSASCTISASITPQNMTGLLSITAQASTPGGLVSIPTDTTVVANDYSTHNVTFVNQCPFNVWYGVTNDSGGQKTDPTPSPASPDSYLLPAQVVNTPPSTKTLSFSTYLGTFFPRTNCRVTSDNKLLCDTGNCDTQDSPNGGKCKVDHEPLAPYTKLEVNLFNTPQSDSSYDGVYEVSVIDGYSIPTEIKGLGPLQTGTPNPNTPFVCTASGAPIQTTDSQLGSSPWTFTPPNLPASGISAIDFNFVKNGGYGTNCNTTGCNNGDTCGLAFVDPSIQNYNITRACGKFLGYWTVSQMCSKASGNYVNFTASNPDPLALFYCQTTLDSIPGAQNYTSSTTVSDLYSCAYDQTTGELNSCYNSGTGSLCCGCYNWNQQNSLVPTAQTVNCDTPSENTSTNPDWTTAKSSGALALSPFDSILWVKQACPTCYSYPFDDKSVSFSCKQSPQGTNVQMNYQIVFCPGGKTGGQ